MRYTVVVYEAPRIALASLDAAVRERIIKRIARMRDEPPGRHLMHGLDFFVEEVGQYRIVYRCTDDTKQVYFIGDHKQYEAWYTRPPTR